MKLVVKSDKDPVPQCLCPGGTSQAGGPSYQPGISAVLERAVPSSSTPQGPSLPPALLQQGQAGGGVTLRGTGSTSGTSSTPGIGGGRRGEGAHVGHVSGHHRAASATTGPSPHLLHGLHGQPLSQPVAAAAHTATQGFKNVWGRCARSETCRADAWGTSWDVKGLHLMGRPRDLMFDAASKWRGSHVESQSLISPPLVFLHALRAHAKPMPCTHALICRCFPHRATAVIERAIGALDLASMPGTGGPEAAHPHRPLQQRLSGAEGPGLGSGGPSEDVTASFTTRSLGHAATQQVGGNRPC